MADDEGIAEQARRSTGPKAKAGSVPHKRATGDKRMPADDPYDDPETRREIDDLKAELRRCEHSDVRCATHDGRRAIACFVCGRLFCNLSDDDYAIAYNPPPLGPIRAR